MYRPNVSIGKRLGCFSSGDTMTCNPKLQPAVHTLCVACGYCVSSIVPLCDHLAWMLAYTKQRLDWSTNTPHLWILPYASCVLFFLFCCSFSLSWYLVHISYLCSTLSYFNTENLLKSSLKCYLFPHVIHISDKPSNKSHGHIRTEKSSAQGWDWTHLSPVTQKIINIKIKQKVGKTCMLVKITIISIIICMII